jgi:hypothetical protein
MAPERAIKELTRQLETLQKLKNRGYSEVAAEEREWDQLTYGIIEGAFGEPSTALKNFRSARFAGQHHTGYISLQEHQANLEARLRQYEGVLRSQINLLRLQLPEEEIKGVYEPGEQYDFYRDLSSLVESATHDIFIVDAYLDEKVFDLYVDKVPGNVTVRILSNRISAKVETVAKMYVKIRPLELRSSAHMHDRVVFIDHRGWVIGQSIKDAATKKLTYMIELDEPLLTDARNSHNRIWAAATVVNLIP